MTAKDIIGLHRVATEICSASKSAPKEINIAACVKALFCIQSIPHDAMTATQFKTILGTTHPALVKFVATESPTRQEYTSRRTEGDWHRISQPNSEMWNSMFTAVRIGDRHDLKAHTERNQFMQNTHECKSYTQLVNALDEASSGSTEDKRRLTDAAVVLYATANSGESICARVCSALEGYAGKKVGVTADQLLAMQQQHCASLWQTHLKDATYQLSSVLQSINVSDFGGQVTTDPEAMNELKASLLADEEASFKASWGIDTAVSAPDREPFIGSVPLNHDGTLDDSAFSRVKGFCNDISLCTSASLDEQVLVTLVAGMRNAPQLVRCLPQLGPACTNRLTVETSTEKRRAAIHDTEYMPNVVLLITEKKQSISPESRAVNTLMTEVNAFMNAAFPKLSDDEPPRVSDVLNTQNVRTWLCANSAGPMGKRLDYWRSVTPGDEARIQEYLDSTHGPSPVAINAFKKLFLPSAF